jgi:hypothetical protein
MLREARIGVRREPLKQQSATQLGFASAFSRLREPDNTLAFVKLEHEVSATVSAEQNISARIRSGCQPLAKGAQN